MGDTDRRFDEIDAILLRDLQEDARTTIAELARRVELAPSAVHERVRKLECRGLIRGYEARLAPACLGLDLLAFVFVKAEERPGEEDTGRRLAQIPNVMEVHHVAGEDCYLVKVRAGSPSELGTLLKEAFGAIPTVSATRTTIVLDSIKDSARLPVPGPADEEGGEP